MRDGMSEESRQQDQTGHDQKHQDQRNGANNDCPPLHSEANNRVVWPSDTHGTSPACLQSAQQKNIRVQGKRKTKEDLDRRCEGYPEDPQHPTQPSLPACQRPKTLSPLDALVVQEDG